MSVFWTLVRNDMDLIKHRRRLKPFWTRFYFLLVIAIIFIFYTISLYTGGTNPTFLGFIPYFLLFAFLVLNIGAVKREWRNHTAGWWLALPYPRTMLLGAKVTAGIIRALWTSVITFALSFAFWMEGMALRSDIWGNYKLTDVLVETGKAYAYVLAISPFLISLSMIVVVIRYSKWRPLAPLLWVAPFVLISLMSNMNNPWIKSVGDGDKDFPFSWDLSVFGLHGPILYISFFLGLYAVTGLIFLGAAYILENHVEV